MPPKPYRSRAYKAAAAAEEPVDPSIYAYDEVYDAMKEAEQSVKMQTQTDPQNRQPKYIENLLQMAKKRKSEQELVRDRRLLAEREQESEVYAEKETFVTGAYRQHQETLEHQEQAEAQAERIDTEDRARGEGGFYRNLLRQTTSGHDAAVRAGLTGQRRKAAIDNAGGSDQARADGGEADLRVQIEAAAKRGEQVVLNDDRQIVDKRELLAPGLNVMAKRKPAPPPAPSAAAATRKGVTAHRPPIPSAGYRSGHASRRSPSPPPRASHSSRPSHYQYDQCSATSHHSRSQSRRDRSLSRSPPRPSTGETVRRQLSAVQAAEEERERAQREALLASFRRRNGEAAVAAARERYLQRRAAATLGS